MPKKKGKKRLKSDESDNDNRSKAGRHGGTPEGVSLSDLLSQASSVLYATSPTGSEENTTSGSFTNDISVSLSSLFNDKSPTRANQDQQGISEKMASNTPNSQEGPSNQELMVYLRKIDSNIGEINVRLKSLEVLEKKMDLFEVDMKTMWNFVQDHTKKTEERLNSVEEKTDSTDFSVGLVNDKFIQLEKEKDKLQEEVVYLTSQSMRNNLVFSNIQETERESTEETEIKVRDFLKEKMKMANELVDRMQFERVHRMGNKTNGKSRNIVAKFTLFKEREAVRKQRKTLQGTQFYVNEQFPKEVVDRRRKLTPMLKEAKKAGKEAWIAYDTLYVDGKPVKPTTD